MNQQTPKKLEEPPYLPYLTPDMPGSSWENAQVSPLRAQMKMRQKQGAQPILPSRLAALEPRIVRLRQA